MSPNVVTVSSRYQIAIPKSVREIAGIQPGTRMSVVSVNGVIHLLPIKPAAAYRGIARGIDTTVPNDPDRI